MVDKGTTKMTLSWLQKLRVGCAASQRGGLLVPLVDCKQVAVLNGSKKLGYSLRRARDTSKRVLLPSNMPPLSCLEETTLKDWLRLGLKLCLRHQLRLRERMALKGDMISWPTVKSKFGDRGFGPFLGT